MATSAPARRLDGGRGDAGIGRAVLSHRRHGAWVWAAASRSRHWRTGRAATSCWSCPTSASRPPTPTAGWPRTAACRGVGRRIRTGPCTLDPAAPGGRRNDLEGPVERRHPAIGAHPAALDQGRRGGGPDVGQRIGRLRAVCDRVRGSSCRCRPGAARAIRVVRDQDAPAKLGRKSPPGLSRPTPPAACRLRRRSSTIKVLHGRGWTAPEAAFTLQSASRRREQAGVRR